MIQSGKQTIKQGEAWVEENPEAWQALKDAVRVDLQLYPDQEMRINYYVEQLRNRKHVSIPNAIQPYFSRRLEKEIPGAVFTKSKSKLNLLMAGEQDA